MKRYIWTFIFLLGACSSTTNIYTGSKIEDMPEEEQRYFRAIARQEDDEKNCPCPPRMTGGEIPFLAAEGSGKPAPAARKIEPDLSAVAPPSADRSAAEDFYVSSLPEEGDRRAPESADVDSDAGSDFPFIDNNQESVSDSNGSNSGGPSGIFSGISSQRGGRTATVDPSISSAASYQPENSKEDDDSVFFSSTPSDDYVQVGTASWYGGDFDGKPTANGEIFDSRKLTAAHKKLPLGSVVLVRNLENNRELVLRVNDRGPYVKGRVLDVSEAGAEKLAFKEKGLTTVGIKILRRGDAEAKDKGTTYKFYRNYTNFEELEEDEPQENGVGGPDEVVEQPASSSSSDPVARDFTSPDSYFFSSKDSSDSRGKKKSSSQRKDYESSQNGKKSKEYMREEMVRGYSVQAGLFENEYNALELKYRLSSLNVPVYVLKRKNMFVVKAGNFGKRDEAEALRYRLLTLGFTTFIADPY